MVQSRTTWQFQSLPGSYDNRKQLRMTQFFILSCPAVTTLHYTVIHPLMSWNQTLAISQPATNSHDDDGSFPADEDFWEG